MQGPNTGLGHTSVVIMIEAQIEHMLKALRHLRDGGQLEPRPEAQAKFVADVDRDMAGSVWTSGGCHSWYLDATGRNSTLWPGHTFTFRRLLERFVLGGVRGDAAQGATTVSRRRISRSIAWSRGRSSRSHSFRWPCRSPARPVRPMRCT